MVTAWSAYASVVGLSRAYMVRLSNHAAVSILFIVSAAQNDHLVSDLTMKTDSYRLDLTWLIKEQYGPLT